MKPSPFLMVAAPIYVPLDDKDRMKEVARFRSKKPLPKRMLTDQFWRPFLESADSFNKMARAIADEQGWGLDHSRKLLATAMCEHMRRDKQLEYFAELLRSVDDHRLHQWCVAQLARSAKWSEDPKALGAMGMIEAAERAVRLQGDDDEQSEAQDLSGASEALAMEMLVLRQPAGEYGFADFPRTDYARRSPHGLKLAALREELVVVSAEPVMFMMLGSTGPELSYLAWSGPTIGWDEESPDPVGLVQSSYVEWAVRVFAFGDALPALIEQRNNLVENPGLLRKLLRPGYERARDVICDALFTYPASRAAR